MYYPQTNYEWFLYLGIAFFVVHILLYGISADLSYFGILLFLIGWFKPVLSSWFTYVLWFFIIIDVYANFTAIRKKLIGPKKEVSIKKKSKSSTEDV
jgi:hypothetical protein